MPSIKLAVSVAALGLCLVLPAFAQDNAAPAAERRARIAQPRQRGGASDPAQRIEEVSKAVMPMATEQQKPKLEDLFTKARGEAAPLSERLAKLEAERQEILQKMNELNRNVRRDLNDILTDEQKLQLRDKLAAEGAGGGGPVAMLRALQQRVQELNLTPDQTRKLEQLRADMQDKFAKAREKAAGDRQAMMAEMRELLPDLRARLQEILTPEQLQQLMPQRNGAAGDRAARRQRAGQGQAQ